MGVSGLMPTFLSGPSVQAASHALVLYLAEDPYGDKRAQAQILVNGVDVFGGPQDVKANRKLGESQRFTVLGSWANPPSVKVSFLNDAYGGADKDRNLYIVSATYDGEVVAAAAHPFYSNGAYSFTPPAPTTKAFVESIEGDAYPDASAPIVNAFNERWAIAPSLQITVNEEIDGTTANAKSIYYSRTTEPGRVNHQNADGNWYWKTKKADPWIGPAADPRPQPPALPVIPGQIQYNPGSARPAVGGGVNAFIADFNVLPGAIVNKAMFGVATGGLSYDWVGHYDMLTNDPAFRAACIDLGLHYVRVNAIYLINDAFGPNATNPPNYTWVDNITNGLVKCFPGAQYNLSFGANWEFNYGDGNIRNNFVNAVKQTLQRMDAGGLHFTHVQAINEPDGGQTPGNVPPGTTVATEVALRNALKPVLPNIVFPTGCTSYCRGDFLTPGAAAGARALDYHYYAHPNGDLRSDDALYQTALGSFNAATDAQNAGRAGAQADYVVLCTEYNLDFTSGSNNDPRQQNWKGAVYSALWLMSGIYGGLAGATIWRIESFDGSYGVFQTGTYNKNSNGVLLKALNAYVGGKVTGLKINSTGTNRLLGLSTIDGDNFGMVLVNYDTAASWTGAVVLPRVATSNVTRININQAQPLGETSVVAPSTLGNVTIPPAGIVILAGAK